MKQRILSGAVIVVVAALLLYFHGWYLAGAVVVFSLISQYEMIHSFRQAGIRTVAPVLYAFAALALPIYYFYGLSAVFVMQMFAVSLVFVAAILFNNKRFDFDSISASIFTLYYPQMFYIFFYMILFVEKPDGSWDMELSRLMLLVAIAASAGTDTAAYFVGSFCGKKKLCPDISPKKTVEGSLGGLVGGVVAVQIVAILFDNGRVHLVEYLIFSFMLSVLAQIGDLAASLIKRKLGVKDYGKLIPGHGGIMDRLDSILFILPVVYMFYNLYLGLG